MARESESQNRTFTPEEVGDIIDTATKLQQLADDKAGSSGTVTMSQLGDIARELGISEETLVKAMKLGEREEKRSVRTERRRARWWRRLASFSVIVAGLAGIDWFSDQQLTFFFYPGIALGVALALQAIRVFGRD